MKIQINLDEERIGDAADLLPGYIAESYWIGGIECAVIADIYRRWECDFDNETEMPIERSLSHWFFGDNVHCPVLLEHGLNTFGAKTIDDIEVTITLENGEKFRLPYRLQPIQTISK